MTSLKSMVEVVVEAEEMLLGGPHLVASVVQDLAWPDETLARETMIWLVRANFDDGTQEAYELRRLMLRTFLGSSSTKEVLESTFAHLRDVVSRHSKNQKSSPAATWFYTIASPYSKLDTCGMQHLMPGHEGWIKWRSLYSRARETLTKQYNSCMNVNATSMPRGRELPVSAAGVKRTKWRLAGPLSHYRSSAALLYLLEDRQAGFANAHRAWAGAFLTCGSFFWHKDCAACVEMHFFPVDTVAQHPTLPHQLGTLGLIPARFG